jgi:predicted short-subunit dehydrogenase-like oxidoreductase (DUF2520 family)
VFLQGESITLFLPAYGLEGSVFFMRIGFIGAGKVGTALGLYLKEKGFPISGYFSRSKDSSIQSAFRTRSNCYITLEQLIEDTDALFITTSDDQIEDVVNKLCSSSRLKSGQLIVHMSGALPSTILSPAKAFGCYIYSLHPLQSFADIDKSVAALADTYFCLEGDEERISMLVDILTTCKNPYFKIKPEQKVLYHASACMLSNYLVTLIHNGLKLMQGMDIDSATAFKAMLPLINSTLQNVNSLGTENALTGPISRGDINTVVKQFEGINADSKDQLKLFAYMASETLKLANLNDSSKTEELLILIESFL